MGAVVTYYGMGAGLFGYAASTLALVMLFSGGTFLFVATVHILSEVMSGEEPLPWLEVSRAALSPCLLVWFQRPVPNLRVPSQLVVTRNMPRRLGSSSAGHSFLSSSILSMVTS